MDKLDLYVVARFLDIMYTSGSAMKRTNIQMILGLNYPRFTEYLEWLVGHELVAKSEEGDEESRLFKLTPKGVDSYHRLVDWIRETMQDIRT